MKRPKIKDMNQLELVRWRILQHRRRMQRTLFHLEHLQEPFRSRPDVVRNRKHAKSVIKVTGPTWVSKASLSDCLTVMRYLGHGNQPQNLH
jgi:hypothetical protein